MVLGRGGEVQVYCMPVATASAHKVFDGMHEKERRGI